MIAEVGCEQSRLTSAISQTLQEEAPSGQCRTGRLSQSGNRLQFWQNRSPRCPDDWRSYGVRAPSFNKAPL